MVSFHIHPIHLGARCSATDMHHPSRPPNAEGGSTGGGGGGGDPQSPSTPPSDGLCVFRGRSMLPGARRASSGYFSSEGGSLPASPRPPAADAATQTPSPAAQVMTHALRRMAEAREHGSTSRSRSARRLIAAEDMQAETIGRELRRIGDDFNRILLLRGYRASSTSAHICTRLAAMGLVGRGLSDCDPALSECFAL
ncbi:bcl-2-like protein 11 isoform X2 [Pungitius pungitius]|uniref:bcl-2-like protein 11 isoform X2 n=1 Tax=Pungitius pungitius TaxID=134920 RepID=UPI002E11741E